MKIIDSIKLAFLLIFRDKKKKIYSIIICICCLTCLGILIFNDSIGDMMSKSLNNNIGFRSIMVMPRNRQKELNKQENIEKDLKDIQKINYVDDVYESEYREVIITKSDFTSENLDGTITLRRANDKTLPTVIEGRVFNDDESGVIICPSSFFPNYNPLNINKEYLINGHNLLDTSFKVYYSAYNKDKRVAENEQFSSEFKVIGIYDTSERIEDNGVCYVPADDLKKIADIQKDITNKKMEEEKNSNITVTVDSGIDIVVNNIENVNYVISELKNIGFEDINIMSYFDSGIINTIYWIIIAILFISILGVTVITILYIKKKLLSDEDNIAILRTSGYSKKAIAFIYMLKTFIYNIILFIIGSLLFIAIFIILTNNLPFLIGINLMYGKLTIQFLPLFIAFILIVIIPSAITYYIVMKKCSIDIHNLIRNGE